MTTIVRIFVAVLVVALIWFLIGMLPIPYPFGTILRILAIVALIIFCLSEGGLLKKSG